ncbi:MAG: YHS domain-containing protein [Candidatus Methanoperedens sp.]|nr:YHS domain-containing protein [Candidatus Methanoperedens sp.]
MPIDPVCWMHVDRKTDLKNEYNGQTYYFCSLNCKKEFEKAPDKYLGVKSSMKMPDQVQGSSVGINEKNPYVALICSHCEFFKEDDIELECAAFKILKSMLRKGMITQEEIKDAFK